MNNITPEIYKDLELLPELLTGWNGNQPIFSRLIEWLKPKHIIEVGTWRGQSAITMATAVKEFKLDTKITCVDTWLGAGEFWAEQKDTPERDLRQKNGYPQVYYQFLSNVVHNKCEDIILPFPNTSFIAARYFKKAGVTADMIYIDGSHEYEDVLLDTREYWKLLNNGGVLFGDDWSWLSVRLAVEQFQREVNVELQREGNDFWFFRKP